MSKTKIAYGQVSNDSLDVEKSVQYDSSEGNENADATKKVPIDAWTMDFKVGNFKVEVVRVAFWSFFFSTILIGMILTYAFSDEDITGPDTAIYKIFGVVNACVFLDFPPASYVVPFLWSYVGPINPKCED